MRAKPDMKPWVHTDKSKMSSVGAALTELVLALRCGCAAPTGLNKCVPMINPGLAPWAMQEYRPYRAPLRLPIYFIILMRLPCNDSMKPLGDFRSDLADSLNLKLSYGRL